MQPIKELSSAAGLRAGRGCVLIRQLVNWAHCYICHAFHCASMQNVSEKVPGKDSEKKKLAKGPEKKPVKDVGSGDLVIAEVPVCNVLMLSL